jgi:hypothetical protein
VVGRWFCDGFVRKEKRNGGERAHRAGGFEWGERENDLKRGHVRLLNRTR